MRKAIAVALLDGRRLSFGLFSLALVAGLVPSLASGLGEKIEVMSMLHPILLLVGIVAGGAFATDFAQGRSSFFFARPLSASVLIAGRALSTAVLATLATAAVMATYRLSANEPREAFVLASSHLYALVTGWALSLYFGLAFVAQNRERAAGGFQGHLVGLGRMALALGLFLLNFGLFSDLAVRAYFTSTPGRVFFGAWLGACLIASFVAISTGRADRPRIARALNLVAYAALALSSLVVAAVWAYVLHPGAAAIEGVVTTEAASSGRLVYIGAKVNRGDPRTFNPLFLLDLESGRAQFVNAEPGQGPWISADGLTVAWNEAMPLFFRPIWKALGGASTIKVREASGREFSLPLPRNLSMNPRGIGDLAGLFGRVANVIPANGGDLFAVQWGGHVTFISRARGEMADVDFGAARRDLGAAVFLTSGRLRAVTARRGGAGSSMDFVDIDPASGALTTLASIEPASVRFDASGARALLTTRARGGRSALSLIELGPGAGLPRRTNLISDPASPDAMNPVAQFLWDGRIAASVGIRGSAALRVFSSTGDRLLNLEMPHDVAPSLGAEMFPGVVAVHLFGFRLQELVLFDLTTGAVVRRLPHLFTLRDSSQAPPGSPAARLLFSFADRTLYVLPSLTAEPRRVLPLARK